MRDRLAVLVAAAQRSEAEPAEVRDAVARLLVEDEVVGTAVVFDILAREPRFKPSYGLVIDPIGAVRRRWQQRVSAAAALIGSPTADRVIDELLDELRDDPDLTRDVLEALPPGPIQQRFTHLVGPGRDR